MPTVITLGGSGVFGSADGPGPLASFGNPYGVAVDAQGSVYVADQSQHRIRKVTASGLVSTFAGTGVAGFADGNAAVARFNSPNGVEVDAAGNVYVADSGNYRIRKITPAGIVDTFAGTSLSRADDGPTSSASLVSPTNIAIDGAGNFYITDRCHVRKINTMLQVSKLAGSGTAGFTNPTGTAASFDSVRGIDVDASGNVYVTDSFNDAVRRITPSGVVSTFAGSGAPGATDGTGTSASFSFPLGLAIDDGGNLYVGDSLNNKIRTITPAAVVSTYAGSGAVGSDDGPAAARRSGTRSVSRSVRPAPCTWVTMRTTGSAESRCRLPTPPRWSTPDRTSAAPRAPTWSCRASPGTPTTVPNPSASTGP